MSAFLDRIKERAKADKKTVVLPESMDRRTFEAAEIILKEDIANLIIIGTKEEIEANSKGDWISPRRPSLIPIHTKRPRNTSISL